ncbi:hypothetical protein Leryth_015416 [Lithospermum erythrorhizon]|nr:hypothetical protein Leryth_015416 [Lithospermum erythrorhizon]
MAAASSLLWPHQLRIYKSNGCFGQAKGKDKCHLHSNYCPQNSWSLNLLSSARGPLCPVPVKYRVCFCHSTVKVWS